MNYVKAEKVLPDYLIREIQKYTQGKYVYIPCEEYNKKGWGENSGSRKVIQNRNEEIRTKYRGGTSMESLCEEYFLSTHSIKKIIYEKRIEKPGDA